MELLESCRAGLGRKGCVRFILLFNNEGKAPTKTYIEHLA